MDRRIFMGAGALAIVGGGALYLNQGPQDTPFDLSVNAQDSADIDTSGVLEMTLGDENAPVTLIEYASFTCPHCARFHADVMPGLKENYVNTGKVRFVYREVFFDRYGLWAAMVARCGGELRYFGIADMLYTRQRDWLAGNDPVKIIENIRAIGREAGISDAELDACFADEDNARALLALYQKNAEADGINSTPSFVLNGTKYGNMSYDELAALIDAELPV